MKISRYFSVFALACAALTLGSCSDYLDIDPENKVPEEQVDYTELSEMYITG